jgi:prepilin-type N-terminal cleavage/methylation domain-containing protein
MMRNGRTESRGATLIELIVTVAIIGVTASVAALAVHPAASPDPADPATIIADTLERVLATGTPVTLTFSVNARPVLATVNPDGTIVADSALVIERLSGRMIR